MPQLNRVYTFVSDVNGFARDEDRRRRITSGTSNEVRRYSNPDKIEVYVVEVGNHKGVGNERGQGACGSYSILGTPSPASVTAVVTSQPSRFDTVSGADIVAFIDLCAAAARIRDKPTIVRE